VASGAGGGGSSSSSSSRPVGLGLWGGLRLRHVPGHVDPLVEEYGMYAKVFATGGAARVDRVAAAAAAAPAGGGVEGSGFGVFSMAAAQDAAAGAIGAQQQEGPTVASGGAAGCGTKQISSGYMAGAMRELSLVALGGGGVVLRLEAYEMASMWDQE
jgi:hypothetical protein